MENKLLQRITYGKNFGCSIFMVGKVADTYPTIVPTIVTAETLPFVRTTVTIVPVPEPPLI